MKLMSDCWSIFEDKDLKTIGEIEQSLATGLDVNGDKIKEKNIIQQILNALLSDKINEDDKLRLVLIAIMTIEITDKQRKDFF